MKKGKKRIYHKAFVKIVVALCIALMFFSLFSQPIKVYASGILPGDGYGEWIDDGAGKSYPDTKENNNLTALASDAMFSGAQWVLDLFGALIAGIAALFDFLLTGVDTSNFSGGDVVKYDKGFNFTIDGIIFGRLVTGKDAVNYMSFEMVKGNPYGIIGATIFVFFKNLIYGLVPFMTLYLLYRKLVCESTKSKVSFKEIFYSVGIFFLFIYVTPQLVDFALWTRDGLLYGIRKLFGMKADYSITGLFSSQYLNDPTIVTAIIYCAAVFTAFSFLKSYAGIAIKQTALFGFFPVINILSIKNKKLLSAWAVETFTNIFVPVIDAILFLIPFAVLSISINGSFDDSSLGEKILSLTLASEGTPPGIGILVICLLGMIVPTRNSILKLLGNSGVLPQRGGIGGVMAGALMAMRSVGAQMKAEAGGGSAMPAPDTSKIDSQIASNQEMINEAQRNASMYNELAGNAIGDMGSNESLGIGGSIMSSGTDDSDIDKAIDELTSGDIEAGRTFASDTSDIMESSNSVGESISTEGTDATDLDTRQMIGDVEDIDDNIESMSKSLSGNEEMPEYAESVEMGKTVGDIDAGDVTDTTAAASSGVNADVSTDAGVQGVNEAQSFEAETFVPESTVVDNGSGVSFSQVSDAPNVSNFDNSQIPSNYEEFADARAANLARLDDATEALERANSNSYGLAQVFNDDIANSTSSLPMNQILNSDGQEAYSHLSSETRGGLEKSREKYSAADRGLESAISKEISSGSDSGIRLDSSRRACENAYEQYQSARQSNDRQLIQSADDNLKKSIKNYTDEISSVRTAEPQGAVARAYSSYNEALKDYKSWQNTAVTEMRNAKELNNVVNECKTRENNFAKYAATHEGFSAAQVNGGTASAPRAYASVEDYKKQINKENIMKKYATLKDFDSNKTKSALSYSEKAQMYTEKADSFRKEQEALKAQRDAQIELHKQNELKAQRQREVAMLAKGTGMVLGAALGTAISAADGEASRGLTTGAMLGSRIGNVAAMRGVELSGVARNQQQAQIRYEESIANTRNVQTTNRINASVPMKNYSGNGLKQTSVPGKYAVDYNLKPTRSNNSSTGSYKTETASDILGKAYKDAAQVEVREEKLTQEPMHKSND